MKSFCTRYYKIILNALLHEINFTLVSSEIFLVKFMRVFFSCKFLFETHRLYVKMFPFFTFAMNKEKFACHYDSPSNNELLTQLSVMIKSWKINLLIWRLVKTCGHWPRTKILDFIENLNKVSMLCICTQIAKIIEIPILQC